MLHFQPLRRGSILKILAVDQDFINYLTLFVKTAPAKLAQLIPHLFGGGGRVRGLMGPWLRQSPTLCRTNYKRGMATPVTSQNLAKTLSPFHSLV